MKLWYSPYSLISKASLNRKNLQTQEGFLVRLQTENFKYGYADCSPLSIFGEESVDVHLNRLKEGVLNDRLDQTMYCAQQDGLARQENKSLFSATPVKSHFTCSNVEILNIDKLDELSSEGFSTIKLKLGRDIKKELAVIDQIVGNGFSKFRWRFDFNSSGGLEFLKSLDKSLLKYIDFIEDPEVFTVESWLSLEVDYGVELAADKSGFGEWGGIRVIKPSRQKVKACDRDVITNSMDHPLGQSFAAYWAQRSIEDLGVQSMDYGFCTGHLFEDTDFLSQINSNGPVFKPSAGYGLGFDDLFPTCNWLPL